jgi:hypothetical protein
MKFLTNFEHPFFTDPIYIGDLTPEVAYRKPEMEFLDIGLTIDSSLLLHAFHSPFCWRILKKNIFYSGFKNPDKKSP